MASEDADRGTRRDDQQYWRRASKTLARTLLAFTSLLVGLVVVLAALGVL